jgi:diguanylate cyclase (GGDEF)-like protein
MSNEHKYTILAVDDAKDTLMLLDFDLSDHGYHVIKASSGDIALSLISNTLINQGNEGSKASVKKTHNVDLILLDIYMPEMSGLATLGLLKSQPQTRDIPVIMLSASDDENEIVQALELGADDYVTKPYIAKVLLARIKTSLRLLTKTEELKRLAKTDFLTKINNRANFYELSTKAISQCRRNQQSLVIAMLDIDFFKKFNDDFGHDIGDLVLVQFANMLSLSFRDYDVVARIGGEEFAVCMPNVSIDDAMVACEKFRLGVQNHQIIIDHVIQDQLNINVSIGVAANVFDNRDSQVSVSELLKLADQALYYAKNNGRNTIVNVEELLLEELTSDILTADNSVNNTGDSKSTAPYKDLFSYYPGIDVAVGLANVQGDKVLFREILVIFYQDHGLDGEKLQKALLTGDIKSARFLIHTLKGVSCSVGAMDLFNKSKVLGSAINTEDKLTFLSLFEQGVLLELNKVLLGIELQLIK